MVQFLTVVEPSPIIKPPPLYPPLFPVKLQFSIIAVSALMLNPIPVTDSPKLSIKLHEVIITEYPPANTNPAPPS